MSHGYQGKPLPIGGFLAQAISYLEGRGWYFDHEHHLDVWERKAGPRDIRESHCWTYTKWGEYWSSDHLDPVGPKPKTRRYECLKDAIWSQILREQEPKAFGGFFQDKEEA